MAHDERGREIPDPTPLEMPLGMRKPESMEDMIRRFVRQEASRVAQAEGMESFEEADDFEVEDDDLSDAPTQYMVPEVGPDGPESLDGIKSLDPEEENNKQAKVEVKKQTSTEEPDDGQAPQSE